MLFAFIFPSLYSSLYKHSLMLCWRVPLIPRRCSWALCLQGRLRLVQSRLRMKLIYPEKKYPDIKPVASGVASSSLVWAEKPLNLAAISYEDLFPDFTVKKEAFVALSSHGISVRLWKPLTFIHLKLLALAEHSESSSNTNNITSIAVNS